MFNRFLGVFSIGFFRRQASKTPHALVEFPGGSGGEICELGGEEGNPGSFDSAEGGKGGRKERFVWVK